MAINSGLLFAALSILMVLDCDAQKADTALLNRWYDSMSDAMYARPKDALGYMHKGRIASNMGEDKAWEGYFLQAAGIIHDLDNQLDSSLYYFEKTIALAKEMKDTVMEANALGNIGVAYHARGYLQPALNYHLAAARLREASSSKQYLGKSYNNIGLLYRMKKDYSKAMEYLNKSLELKQKDEDEAGMVTTLMNMGSCFQHTGQYDSALAYARNSLNLASQIGDKENEAAATGNIGLALLSLGKTEQAKTYLTKALQLFGNGGNDEEYFSIFQGLSKYYLQKGDLSQSKDYTLHGLQKARQMQRREQEVNFLKSLANITKMEGNGQLAFTYLEQATQLNDSLLNEANIRQMNEMNILYETELKESEIQKLTTEGLENRLKLLENNRQRNVLMTAFAFAAVIAIIIGYSLKKNKEKSALLAKQNEIIEKQLKEKEILMGEIHHRVKNNLQIISGLLNLQSRHIADPNALQAVREGRNRVKSIALIHQQLYQRESLTAINLKHYLKDLMQSIDQSFRDSGKEITHQVACPELLLDVEAAVPIGLIVNELVTNSYKHAFHHKNKGIITLHIEADEPSMQLIIQDNGDGLPEGFNLQEQKSFGLKMINTLVNKLKASFTIEQDSGAKFILHIPNYSDIS
jgi:two-component system, sensor histidine kinase PdtaS